MDRHSIIGIVVFLGNSPIARFAKKQCSVPRSSTEAVYRALASIAAVYSALAITSNPVYHAQTKYIEVDYHFVHEKVLRRDLLVKFISTHDQLADLFTKGLPSPRFIWLTSKLMWKFPIHLRGYENLSSEYSNHEEGTIPMATPKPKTVSSVRVVKYKTRLKSNIVVSY